MGELQPVNLPLMKLLIVCWSGKSKGVVESRVIKIWLLLPFIAPDNFRFLEVLVSSDYDLDVVLVFFVRVEELLLLSFFVELVFYDVTVYDIVELVVLVLVTF